MSADSSSKCWVPVTQNGLKCLKDVGPTVKTKVNRKLTSIQQERHLLFHLLVISRAIPELVTEDVIGEYELNVAPPSNFHPDVSLIIMIGKSKLVQLILNLPIQESQISNDDSVFTVADPQQMNVLLTDAICVVNIVPNKHDITTAEECVNRFLGIINGMSNDYYDFRVVFHQYISKGRRVKRESRTEHFIITLMTTPT